MKSHETYSRRYFALMEKLETATFMQPSEIPRSVPSEYGRLHPFLFAHRASGFMVGQAEKVASGACEAFMLRVESPDWFAWAFQCAQLICQHYQLDYLPLPEFSELWGCSTREGHASVGVLQAMLRTLPVNSPGWHECRARLCGIEIAQIDLAHHTRHPSLPRIPPWGYTNVARDD